MLTSLLHRIAADRDRYGRRIMAWGTSALAFVFFVVFWLGPFERPAATILFAGSIGFLAFLVGIDLGVRRRLFVPLMSGGLRVSQSIGKVGDQLIYKTYDMANRPAEIALDDAVDLTLDALSTFGVSAVSSHGKEEQWSGAWVYLACDTKAQPIYIDLTGVLEMLAFLNSHIRDAGQRMRIREQLSKLENGSGEFWESAFDA